MHLRVSGVMLAVTLRAFGARRPSVRGRICIVWEKRVFCLAYIHRYLFVFVLLCFTHSHKRGTSANVRGNIFSFLSLCGGVTRQFLFRLHTVPLPPLFSASRWFVPVPRERQFQSRTCAPKAAISCLYTLQFHASCTCIRLSQETRWL